ncbi:hypothetical protein CARUB_v10001538mg [Capsella rubella]|uniref:Centromere protein O n=1 Tax=Capsella rubella TaxID=81985 RepID=R0HBX4_9BRAS|nr:uncharacterized protein LOC17883911 [Capsella rubella]XP_023636485.1 uncharacterized protein LOC17883911 [Capsella rubella]XP_023636486.1 uncharacterized protein LOC17883911 [Capsella rubella]EOA21193.1 hypothetical protein CARUB_v10001538mg [Capsella rubella]
MGEMIVSLDQDIRLDTTRARFSNLLKRHRELTNRLTRDSDKTIFDRLNKEFEAARASQSQEVCLYGEEWNDGLLATLRERVHMEADRKADNGNAGFAVACHPEERVTYRVGNKMICCLEGARIGIQYETSTAGEVYEVYHCVLESKSFLEKMTVLEHTIPFFLPIRDLENDLCSNAKKFIDNVGELLQAYVERKEQVRLMNELYGNQINELYNSLPYHMVEFAVDDCECKVMVSLRYGDLMSELPTKVRVLVWPMHHQSKKHCTSPGSQTIPVRLSFAEDALRIQSLPEAYAEIMVNLPQEIEQIFQ